MISGSASYKLEYFNEMTDSAIRKMIERYKGSSDSSGAGLGGRDLSFEFRKVSDYIDFKKNCEIVFGKDVKIYRNES